MPRRVSLDLSAESIPGQFNLRSRELGGLRSWSRDHGSETAAISKNRVIVFGPNVFGGKPGEMHDPPESIASARKVVTCRCRTDTWINSAKYHRQVRF